jgi:hypothetical protein
MPTIPGPVDEAALLIVGAVLWVFYRANLRDAWNMAGRPQHNSA